MRNEDCDPATAIYYILLLNLYFTFYRSEYLRPVVLRSQVMRMRKTADEPHHPFSLPLLSL